MFDLDFGKLVVIGVIALIAIGPKELPAVLRTVGQYMAKIRRMAAEFQGQFQEAMREAEMADMKKHMDEINDAAKGLTSGFDPLGVTHPQTAGTPPEQPAAAAPSPSAGEAAPADAVVALPEAAAAVTAPRTDAPEARDHPA